MQKRKVSLLFLIMIGLLTIKAQKCGKNQTGLANKLTSVDDDLIKSNKVSNLESQASLPSSESLVSTDLPIIQRLRTTSKMGILTPAEIIQTNMVQLRPAENLIPVVDFKRFSFDMNVDVLQMDFDRSNLIIHYELEISKIKNYRYSDYNPLVLDFERDYYFNNLSMTLHFNVPYSRQKYLDSLPSHLRPSVQKPIEGIGNVKIHLGGSYNFYFNHITKRIKGSQDLKLRRNFDEETATLYRSVIDNEDATYSVIHAIPGKINFLN